MRIVTPEQFLRTRTPHEASTAESITCTFHLSLYMNDKSFRACDFSIFVPGNEIFDSWSVFCWLTRSSNIFETPYLHLEFSTLFQTFALQTQHKKAIDYFNQVEVPTDYIYELCHKNDSSWFCKAKFQTHVNNMKEFAAL